MRRWVSALLLAVVAALAVSPAAALAIDAPTLRAKVLSAMRRAGPYSGAYVRDIDTGQEIVAVRASTPRIPASVEKLFVSATALLRFGPGTTLATRALIAKPSDAEGVIDGDLYLVGGGDPTLSDARLRRLARAVRAAGVSAIEGSVAADDTWFDRRRGGPRTNFQADADMGGRLGALVIGRGFQADPAVYAAARLAHWLRSTGIDVRKQGTLGKAPAGALEVAATQSPAVRDLARLQNVPSDNFVAEMMLKNLGAAFGDGGTTGAGASVVRTTLDDFGVRPRVYDGSGLSRANRTSPRQVVRLFERMDGQPVAGSFLRSLAVTGRSGTVARRMRGTAASGRCSVKTGTLLFVSNLAGVCTTAGGQRLAFAWLMNGVNVWSAHALQDRMTVAVSRYTG